MSTLPEQFKQLESFVDTWARASELQRSEQRWKASPDEYQAFYDAMLPVLDEALEYLDKYTVGDMPQEALALYHLTLCFAEAAPHTELYSNAAQVPNSFLASRFVAAHGEDIDA